MSIKLGVGVLTFDEICESNCFEHEQEFVFYDHYYELNQSAESLKKQNEIMRSALSFYANENNWYGSGAPFNEDKTRRMIIASIDTEGSDWIGGKKAREALLKSEEAQ